MIIAIDEKARPCPGVENALSLAEDLLRRGEPLYAAGDLIHNEREMKLLEEMGLKRIPKNLLADPTSKDYAQKRFLVRTHGEAEETLQAVRKLGMIIVDATCPIVKHSHEIIAKHIKEGWRIVIVGSKDHPEVTGLLAHAKPKGIVLSSEEEARKADLENMSLLMAQTTVNPDLYARIRKILSSRYSSLKIMDTTCRFIRNRQEDVRAFAAQHDLILVVGGLRSSNCKLLYQTALEVNPRSHLIQEPVQIDLEWLQGIQSIGITGGASTPKWQLDEVKSYLSNHPIENPKGLKNKKGGIRLWWTPKNNRT